MGVINERAQLGFSCFRSSAMVMSFRNHLSDIFFLMQGRLFSLSFNGTGLSLLSCTAVPPINCLFVSVTVGRCQDVNCHRLMNAFPASFIHFSVLQLNGYDVVSGQRLRRNDLKPWNLGLRTCLIFKIRNYTLIAKYECSTAQRNVQFWGQLNFKKCDFRERLNFAASLIWSRLAGSFSDTFYGYDRRTWYGCAVGRTVVCCSKGGQCAKLPTEHIGVKLSAWLRSLKHAKE